MSTNDFLPFCATDTGSNLESQADYLADAGRLIGNQPGIASSKFVNKAMRQSAFIMSQIAQYISNQTGSDVLDNADTSALLALIGSTFIPWNVVAKTTTYTAVIKDFINASAAAAYNITLPTAVGHAGFSIAVRRTDNSLANPITILTTSSQTIGAFGTSVHLQTQGETWVFVSDGANWSVEVHLTETPWTSFTPTVGATTTPPTYGGTVTLNARWRRLGQDVLVQYFLNIPAAAGGSIGSGTYLWPFPANIAANSSIISINNSITTHLGQQVGGCFALQNTGSPQSVAPYMYDTANMKLYEVGVGTVGSTNGGATAEQSYGWTVQVPATNWEP